MNKLSKIKVIAIIIATVMVASVCSNVFNVVFASNDAIIQLNGMSVAESGFAVYKDNNNNMMGRVIALSSEGGFSDETTDISNITFSGGSNKYEWTGLAAGTYKFKVEVSSEYNLNVTVQQSPVTLNPIVDSENEYTFDVVVSGGINMIDLNFQPKTGPGPQEPGPQDPGQQPFFVYDVIAKFEGVSSGVNSDLESNILVPENWTEGKVEFYAKTCKVNGNLEPYHDGMNCDPNSYEEVRLDIEGIANIGQINRSVGVEGPRGEQVAVFKKEFADYGKATFHLVTEQINMIVSVKTEDLLFVRAEAKLGMTYSLGSAAIDNAILTNKQAGNVSIFFGNTETTIRAEGTKVSKISNVVGGAGVEYNADGTATVTLPSLSTETTTKLVLTIELQDGKTITRNLNVVRTAIELGFNTADGNATLEAGYVVNKGYLYNNKNHDDNIFNAYLQVILYKDGVVAGYRQVKIDDKDLVNRLNNNESGSMELLSDDHINLYGKELKDTIEGVNSASVFLTNGPIEFDSDTLPSVEFGIGSGVTIEFGGEE